MGVRHYPVPAGARDAVLGAVATMDDIDFAATRGNEWAHRVISKENSRLIQAILGDDAVLPFGLAEDDTDDEIVVTGLTRGEQDWTPAGWQPGKPDHREAIALDSDEVAFVARAFVDGYAAVVLRGYTPTAVLAASGPRDDAPADLPADQPAGSSDLPAGARVLAVVDDLDRNAVIDVIAVTPGPHVLRRHDGKWETDDGWISVLRSVKPPPVVVLEEAQLGSVLPQVDSATAGNPFEPTGKPKRAATVASAYDHRADEMAIEFAILRAGLIGGVTAASATSTVNDLTGHMPGKLARYWRYGEGAAKIRWGTPGAMRRCARHLAKYVGPGRAYQTCNNLSKPLGGKGVAWDVG
jgi:hypothetical protein